jgi:hypothetical protein
MKKTLIVIGVALLATISQAKNIGDQIAGFVLTNAAVDVEGFRGLSGNKDIVAFTYAKDITTNAAVLLTYDRCFTPSHSSDFQSDKLTGGLNLNTTVKWFTVGGYEVAGVTTSGQNNGQAVNVLGTYIDYQYKNFVVGVLYQNRVENDLYKGNYIGFHVGYVF